MLRCFQHLSLPHIATQRCLWQDNWYTSGASIPVLSYCGFLAGYRQGTALFERHLFFPGNRALRPEGLLHSRGVAPSDFRPLRKIPYCCLP
ncbi:hypothetical protein DN050_10545 [Heyndrickxia coagulans]|nr:hypothetical protein DN050_10545 [Heyndrickxia coagulans]